MFGCATYAHDRRDKLQARAKKCIFLGYSEGEGVEGGIQVVVY